MVYLNTQNMNRSKSIYNTVPLTTALPLPLLLPFHNYYRYYKWNEQKLQLYKSNRMSSLRIQSQNGVKCCASTLCTAGESSSCLSNRSSSSSSSKEYKGRRDCWRKSNRNGNKTEFTDFIPFMPEYKKYPLPHAHGAAHLNVG